ncbi:transposase [Holospora elegans E1]|uniref:Transposase n=1 Tax=Holospora elegans E1 TaxID=1427503 RepID=A0A023DZQ0_9PROT|nr:IS630 transposase-related protein [Holospora elegans]GAJ46588.1 transposase [Holospora elegans E1]
MTCSVQFCKKVLKSQSERESYSKLSEKFKISIPTLSRWKKKIKPKLRRNKPPIKDNEALKKDIKEYPDSYSYERAKGLE